MYSASVRAQNSAAIAHAHSFFDLSFRITWIPPRQELKLTSDHSLINKSASDSSLTNK